MTLAVLLCMTLACHPLHAPIFGNEDELRTYIGSLNMKQSSSPSRQDTLQTGQPDSQTGTFHDASVESTDPADCPRCGSSNSRKRRIRCSTCYSQWHLTCVRLTRRQAEALSSWLCPRCTCTTHVHRQPGRSVTAYPVPGAA